MEGRAQRARAARHRGEPVADVGLVDLEAIEVSHATRCGARGAAAQAGAAAVVVDLEADGAFAWLPGRVGHRDDDGIEGLSSPAVPGLVLEGQSGLE